MYTLLIFFILFKLSFARLFGRELNLKLYIFILFVMYTVIILNQEHLINLDFQVTQILNVSIYKKIKVSFVIFLALVILLGLNFDSLITKFADYYLLFLIYVFHEKTLPLRFITVTVFFGSFVGRQISIYLDLSIIKAFFLMFVLGVLSFFMVYAILVGFFLLCHYYGKSWGNAVFNYLLKKISPSVQQKLDPSISKPTKKNFSKLNKVGNSKTQQKRQYSSSNCRLGILEKLSSFCLPKTNPPATTGSGDLNFFLNNIDSVCSEGVSALEKPFNTLKIGPSYAQTEVTPSQLSGLAKSGANFARTIGPAAGGVAVGAATLGDLAYSAHYAANSETLDESLDKAVMQFENVEQLGGESNSPGKLKKRHSSQF